MCSMAWNIAEATVVYNLLQPVRETHFNEFISIISNIGHWHFTRQLEIFHLVCLLAYLEGYLLVYIWPSKWRNKSNKIIPKGRRPLGKIC